MVNQNSVQESAEYAIANFSEAMIFRNREALWDFCIARVPQIQFNGIIAEFGVWKGESINYLAKRCPNSRVFGFDSFENLIDQEVMIYFLFKRIMDFFQLCLYLFQ